MAAVGALPHHRPFLASRTSTRIPTRHSPTRVATRRTLRVTAASVPESVEREKFDARGFRRSLGSTGRYVRNPWSDADSIAEMESDGSGYSKTGLLAQMRANGNRMTEGQVSLVLAEAMGYCWGVERAVQMAYEAVNAYPGRKLHLTNEIIHNPGVNQRMSEKGYNFIDVVDGEKDFSGVSEGDVVLLPAFGASVQEMKVLKDKKVQIVDTTCPWVTKVWNAVDKQTKRDHTSIIHGKWAHEETIATASFAHNYVIVRDLTEAQYVCDYILNGGDRTEFLSKFENAVSEGFDPDTMLESVGLANQTTMLKGETEAMGKLLEKTMMQKYGPQDVKDHFMLMDTICDATQERQDAMYQMTGATGEKVDVILVVGGFNSSNTSHLQEIGEMAGITSYWIDSAERINVEEKSITWQDSHHNVSTTTNFLPEGKIVLGVTSGASTPDKAVELCLERIFKIKG